MSRYFNKANYKQSLLNTVFILFSLSLLVQFTKHFFSTYGYESWQISEFLINYQGGFVRRGLFGEILLFFAKNFNIDVEWTIKIICLLCIVAVCTFFVRAFLKKGYSLYILPLCFFLGGNIFTDYWIRKDYLFFCFFIPILWIYTKNNMSTILKVLIINILAASIILTHEVFVFFTLPILFLLFFNQYKSKGVLQSFALSLLCLLPIIFVSLLVVLLHGNTETAGVIWNSWSAILNQEITTIGHSVKAIGWSSSSTFKYHFWSNFLYEDQSVLSSFIWIITFPVIYYIATNTLFAFRKNEKDFTNQHRTLLSSVLIFQFVCLIPVFTVLSCDYVRTIFYWIASSFAIFLWIPIDKIERLFPDIYVRFVERINRVLTKFLFPSKTTLVFMMLFIGISRSFCIIEYAYKTTILYNILSLLSQSFLFLVRLF